MIAKIKKLAKKAWKNVKDFSLRLVQWISSAEKPREILQKAGALLKSLWGRLRHWAKKLGQFIKTLWMSSETRILLILIAAVLVLLILALILFFGTEWSNTVGICYQGDTDSANAAYRQALEQSLARRGFELIITDADGDQSRQLEQIDDLAQRRCKVLIVEPVMGSDGQVLLNELENAKVPAVLINWVPEEIGASEHQKITCVQSDPAMAGTVQAEMVLSLPDGGDINGDGIVSYVVLQTSETSGDGPWIAQQFQTNLTESGAVHELLKTGNVKTEADGGWQLCTDILATYGKDIEVILCTDDRLTASAARAVEDFGRLVGSDIYLFGVGAETDILRLISDGSVSGTVDTEQAARVQAVIDAVLAQVGGRSAEVSYQARFAAVTADNIRQLLPEEE